MSVLLRIGVILVGLTSIGFLAGNATAQASGVSETNLEDPQLNSAEITRQDIRLPKLNRRDLNVGIWAGLISLEDFGVNTITGVRAGYQVTENIFFEARYAQSQGSETSFESLNKVRLLTDQDRELKFYDIGAGYQVSGQIFLTERYTFTSNLYLVGSVGNTQFAGSDEFTATLGAGANILLNRWLLIYLEGRDHWFDSELLAESKTAHNLVFSLGASTFF